MASFREQQIRFPFDDDAVRVNRVLRERQLDVVRSVPLDEWTRPSRCTGWSVHDVVRHVVQMNEVMVGVVTATRAGERYERMRRFDPKTTPSAWLAEAPAAEPEETLVAFERSTRAVIDVGDALGGDVLVGSPVGLQPWPRVVLHALFDAMVHERDVTEPWAAPRPPPRSCCRCWPTFCWSRRGSPASPTASSPCRWIWAGRCWASPCTGRSSRWCRSAGTANSG